MHLELDAPRAGARALILVVATCGAWACVSIAPPTAGTCAQDSDCPDTLRCYGGNCDHARSDQASAASGVQDHAEGQPQVDPATTNESNANSAAPPAPSADGHGSEAGATGAASGEPPPTDAGEASSPDGDNGWRTSLPKAFSPCTDTDAISCGSDAPNTVLRCDGNKWQNGFCTGRGTCERDAGDGAPGCVFKKLSLCEGQQPGTTVCLGQAVYACHPDDVHRTQTCTGELPECADGKCACISRCEDACVVLASDSRHCGSCGRDCLGGECRDGVCLPALFSSLGSASQLVLDASYLYWGSDDSVIKAPLSGAKPAQLATGSTYINHLAVDGGNIYWIDSKSGNVMKMGSNGEQPTAVASGLTEPHTLAVDGGYLHFLNGSPGSSALMRVATRGGAVTTLSPANPPIVVAGNHVYFADGPGLQRVPAAGGTAEDVATIDSRIESLVADASNIYVLVAGSSAGNGSVLRVPLAGGTPFSLANKIQSSCPLTIDDRYVYWHDAALQSLMRRSTDGTGSVQSLSSGYNDLGAIAVDATAIYFSTGGTVLKLGRPQ